jgi:hypothetical protein
MSLDLTAGEAAAIRLLLDELSSTAIVDALRASAQRHRLPLDDIASAYSAAVRKIDNFVHAASEAATPPTPLLTVIAGAAE